MNNTQTLMHYFLIKKNLLITVLLTSLWCFGKSTTKTFTNQLNVPDSLQSKSAQEIIKYIEASNTEQSIILEATLSNLITDLSILAEYYYDISDTFYEKEKTGRSRYYLKKAINNAKTAGNDSILSKYFIGLGHSYLKDWKNQKSLDHYNKALDIASKYKNIRHQYSAHSGMAIILKRMKKLDDALEVCKGILKQIEKSKDRNTINHVRFLTILSEVYLDQNNYDSVIYYADQGLAISEPLDYSIGSIDLYTKKGIVALNRKELAKAQQYFRKAEEIILTKNISQKKSILNINYFFAHTFIEEKKYNQAISSLNNSISIIEEKDTRNIRVLETYILLAECYTKIQNTNEATYWYQKLNKLRDQFQEAKHQTISKINNQKINKLESQIEHLKNEEIKQAYHKKLIFFILITVCLILLFFVFKYFQKQKKNNQQFNQLIEKINSLESIDVAEKKGFVIDDKKVKDVLNGLEKLEQQKYFLQKDCDLRSIAKKVKTNTTYLSKIIKTHKAASFNDYINELRIDYALKRLKNDKKFRSFSVKSIALEIGYKTDNSFTKHFKSKTGLNPSYYIKKIDHQRENS
ncbi:helix-turn-helix domain-containing protein [uncultured Aquimarina sp.]|uniref:helix-turn-helix domain-containing protein n=1 Tax=uncultured Aquimarina sp. TaxID=575652 RepID=UPI00262D95A8|nr:helix-turn-helix domain-containing protein [uncultured Aquimarina sp.]